MITDGRDAGIGSCLFGWTELSDAGLVFTERAGSALMYRSTSHHLAAEPLIALVQLRGHLVARLREEVSKLPGLAGAWLFGSAARGDGGRGSDVDLLFVDQRTVEGAEWTECTTCARESGCGPATTCNWSNTPAGALATKVDLDDLLSADQGRHRGVRGGFVSQGPRVPMPAPCCDNAVPLPFSGAACSAAGQLHLGPLENRHFRKKRL